MVKPAPKVAIFIQARMQSTRLPHKVLKDLCGKPVLRHIVDRCKKADAAEHVVVLAPDTSDDEALVEFGKNQNIEIFQGPQNNVLERFYKAAQEFQPNVIVRLTGDNPIVPIELLQQMVHDFLQGLEQGSMVYMNNHGEPPTFPTGVSIEIFTKGLLDEAYHNATEDFQREHVTPYMRLNDDIPKIYVHAEKDDSRYRITLDTPEDWQVIKAVFEALYPKNPYFGYKEAVAYLDEHPEVASLNAAVVQKAVTSTG